MACTRSIAILNSSFSRRKVLRFPSVGHRENTAAVTRQSPNAVTAKAPVKAEVTEENTNGDRSVDKPQMIAPEAPITAVLPNRGRPVRKNKRTSRRYVKVRLGRVWAFTWSNWV